MTTGEMAHQASCFTSIWSLCLMSNRCSDWFRALSDWEPSFLAVLQVSVIGHCRMITETRPQPS